MSLVISGFTGITDDDAGAYIAAVEAADGQLLEFAVSKAINDFIVGCKLDGTWSAIKASCILAGARTLNGALTTLKPASAGGNVGPTNVGGLFVAGDYNRKTGLVGDGSTKYLDSNRNNNADPQNNQHLAFYASSGSTAGIKFYIGSSPGTTVNGTSFITTSTVSSRNGTGNNRFSSSSSSGAFFSAITRNSSGSFFHRSFGSTATITINSATPHNANISVFTAGTNPLDGVVARLAFYSIGESLNLALLDARVSNLISAFAAAIP